MHPRIKELYYKIKWLPVENLLSRETLFLLKKYGATRTEASITLHQGFNLDLDQVDDFVLKSNIWNKEDLIDVFYESLKYLYYNPDDPDYESDDNGVRVSF